MIVLQQCTLISNLMIYASCMGIIKKEIDSYKREECFSVASVFLNFSTWQCTRIISYQIRSYCYKCFICIHVCEFALMCTVIWMNCVYMILPTLLCFSFINLKEKREHWHMGSLCYLNVYSFPFPF
jgi:hypothetical protein